MMPPVGAALAAVHTSVTRWCAVTLALVSGLKSALVRLRVTTAPNVLGVPACSLAMKSLKAPEHAVPAAAMPHEPPQSTENSSPLRTPSEHVTRAPWRHTCTRSFTGERVGCDVGLPVGSGVGAAVGAVGLAAGVADGSAVGAVGATVVGLGVGPCLWCPGIRQST